MDHGRHPIEQARGAIHDHAQATIEPTDDELAAIADFQTTATFFSSAPLRRFAAGGHEVLAYGLARHGLSPAD